MNFSYFTAKRLALGRKSFSSFIMRIGIAAIAVSIAVMILAIGIMDGYKEEITARITGFNAHMLIRTLDFNESYEANPIPDNEPYLDSIRAIPGIDKVQGFAQKAGIIKTEQGIEGIILKGIGHDYDTRFLNESIVKGRLPLVSDSLMQNEIMLSRFTARKLDLDTGVKINIYFVEDENAPFRIRRLKVVGIYETGLDDYDKTYGIVDLRGLRKLYGWRDNWVEGLEIQTSKFEELDRMTRLVEGQTPPQYQVMNARELRPQIFDWLSLLDTNVIIIITLMIVVAAINIITALLILILERTNMIGILKAMGASNKQIRGVFLYKAAYLILVGLLLGNGIGFGLGILQSSTGLFQLDPSSYYLSQVPFTISWPAMILVNIGTFLFCLLALLIPVRLVSRIQPVKAIRFE